MKKKQINITIHEDALNAVIKLASDLDKSVDELLEEAIACLIKKYKTSPRKIEHYYLFPPPSLFSAVEFLFKKEYHLKESICVKNHKRSLTGRK